MLLKARNRYHLCIIVLPHTPSCGGFLLLSVTAKAQPIDRMYQSCPYDTPCTIFDPGCAFCIVTIKRTSNIIYSICSVPQYSHPRRASIVKELSPRQWSRLIKHSRFARRISHCSHRTFCNTKCHINVQRREAAIFPITVVIAPHS